MTNNGNEFLPNYVEYIVPLQEKKRLLWKRFAIIGLAVFLVVLFTVVIALELNFLAGFVPFFLLGIGVLVWYLWRFVSVEFEYTILGGEISFDIIYGRRQRKKYYSTPIHKIEKIAPVEGKELTKESFPNLTREVFCASRMDNPKTWYALVSEEGGGKTLLFFEMTDKTEKVLKFYNGRAFFA